MDRIEEEGGEEVVFQVLDERFPAEATHDRLGKVLDQVFDLKVDKGESTAVYTGKARAAFAAAEAEGVVLPEVARGYGSRQAVVHREGCGCGVEDHVPGQSVPSGTTDRDLSR